MSSDFGAGGLNHVTDSFSRFTPTGCSGALVTGATSLERNSTGNYAPSFDYNTFGEAIKQKTGTLEFNQHFDEAGNVQNVTPPSRWHRSRANRRFGCASARVRLAAS